MTLQVAKKGGDLDAKVLSIRRSVVTGFRVRLRFASAPRNDTLYE
jgi:hypothetical protein